MDAKRKLSPSVVLDDPQLEPLVSRSRERFEGMLAFLDEARTRGELPLYLEEPLAELRAKLGYD